MQPQPFKPESTERRLWGQSLKKPEVPSDIVGELVLKQKTALETRSTQKMLPPTVRVVYDHRLVAIAGLTALGLRELVGSITSTNRCAPGRASL